MIGKSQNSFEPAQLMPSELSDQMPETVSQWRIESMKLMLRGSRREVDGTECVALVVGQHDLNRMIVDDHGSERAALAMVTRDQVKHELDVDYGLGDSRRNVVTRGVPLNHLVGKEFWIGEVKARGLKLCEPCSHLQKLSHEKVLPGLVHRGGLRAQILSEGVIRVGEKVKESK